MKKQATVCVAILMFCLLSVPLYASVQADCMNSKGKFSPCVVDNQNGALVIEFKGAKHDALNRIVPGNKIMRITTGEYARRRVAEAVLFTPWLLFSKKQRQNFGVEFTTDSSTPDIVVIQTKKKYAMAVKSLLQAVSGKHVEAE